jgi:hypothetical protein
MLAHEMLLQQLARAVLKSPRYGTVTSIGNTVTIAAGAAALLPLLRGDFRPPWSKYSVMKLAPGLGNPAGRQQGRRRVAGRT